jgi:hypothetical protein
MFNLLQNQIMKERAGTKAHPFGSIIRRQRSPGEFIFSITWSMVKLAAFMRGGYSLKDAKNLAT